MDNEERYERHMPIEMSILGSLLEIREMRAGRLPEKTWREVRDEIEAEIAAEEREELNDNVEFYIRKKKFLKIWADIKTVTDELVKGNLVGVKLEGFILIRN